MDRISLRERSLLLVAAASLVVGSGCTRTQRHEAPPEASEAVKNTRKPAPYDPNAPVTVVPGDKLRPLQDTAAPDAPSQPGAEAAPGQNQQPREGSPAPPNAAISKRSAVGTNLDQLADWSPEQPFVDLFKTSREWISGSEDDWEDHRPISVDEQGWVRALLPGQVARTTLLWEGVPLPAGNYTVLTEGEGTIEYAPQNGAKEQVKHKGAGSHTLALDPSRGGFSITILATNPANPLRNIRVLMPGGSCAKDPAQYCSETQPCADASQCVSFASARESIKFNPLFLDKLRNYSVLRFMDWMKTNEDMPRPWSARPKPSDARYSRKGAPVELMVELANQTGKDPWFCMPHLANDDYVSHFAEYVRDHLDKGRKAYVEYSNEVWNSQFPQADHARNGGTLLHLSRDEYEGQMRFYAKRATHIMKLWERAFGGSTSRIVRVIASQAGNAWVSKQILKFQDTAEHADALAVAPYFGGQLGTPELQRRVQHMNVDQLLAELRQKVLPKIAEELREQADVAGDFHLPLIAYEGGQHLTGVGPVTENDRINALFDAANRDPRMKDIYAQYLAIWRKSGGRLFVHFSNCARYSKWGRWGALESLMQGRGRAPKFDALQDFIARNPRWW